MGRPVPSILIKRNRYLGNLKASKCSLNNHLAGEFHACSLHVKLLNCLLGKSTQPAMKIVNGGAEEQAADSSKSGVANPAMLPGHSTRHNPSASGRETTTNHPLISLSKLFYKRE